MVKVMMTRTTKGSPDHININEYIEGEVYNLPGYLADNFIGQGAALIVVDAPIETKVEEPDEVKEVATKTGVQKIKLPSRKTKRG